MEIRLEFDGLCQEDKNILKSIINQQEDIEKTVVEDLGFDFLPWLTVILGSTALSKLIEVIGQIRIAKIKDKPVTIKLGEDELTFSDSKEIEELYRNLKNIKNENELSKIREKIVSNSK